MAPRVPEVENDPSPRRSQQRGGEGQGAGAACDIWPPRCSLWPIGCGSTPAALQPEYSRRNPSHNSTKGEREERGRERRDTAGESSGAGGEGTRARSRNVALYAAFATPRGRDSSSLATDEGCCTKSLRQPRARAQNPYSPARSWHPRSVSHPSSLSFRLRARTGPLLGFLLHPSPLALFALLVALDDSTLRFSLSRSFDRVSLSLDRVFLFLDTKGGGQLVSSRFVFTPLFRRGSLVRRSTLFRRLCISNAKEFLTKLNWIHPSRLLFLFLSCPSWLSLFASRFPSFRHVPPGDLSPLSSNRSFG